MAVAEYRYEVTFEALLQLAQRAIRNYERGVMGEPSTPTREVVAHWLLDTGLAAVAAENEQARRPAARGGMARVSDLPEGITVETTTMQGKVSKNGEYLGTVRLSSDGRWAAISGNLGVWEDCATEAEALAILLAAHAAREEQ